MRRILRPAIAFALLLATLAISGTGEQEGNQEGPPEGSFLPLVEEPPGAERDPRPPRLDLSRLDRSGFEPALVDIFAPKSWVPPPPPPPPPSKPVRVAPAPPTAPPLPFAYAGRLEYPDGKPMVYLTKAKRVYVVGAGELVDTDYRLESISESQLVFVYLPMKTQQTLTIPPK